MIEPPIAVHTGICYKFLGMVCNPVLLLTLPIAGENRGVLLRHGWYFEMFYQWNLHIDPFLATLKGLEV